jgi:hypothetical protein
LKQLVLDYFRLQADGGKKRLWQSKLFWLANCFAPFFVIALDYLTMSMNGNSPGLTVRETIFLRLSVCAVGILLNSILVVFVKPYKMIALTMIIINIALGIFYWYVFVIRHGAAIGFWIF